MENRMIKPPVIILGMHRSGTTMITRMLQDMGLFVGNARESNCEAWFFLLINRWLLRKSGGRWDYPAPIHSLINSESHRLLYQYFVKRMIRTPFILSFLGVKNYIKYRGLDKLDFPWGWKDPRNTFTLPFWTEVFPRPKVIHIYRHGVDVANSLVVRQQKAMHNAMELKDTSPLLYFIRMYYGEFAASMKCDSMEGAIELWDQYLGEARKNIKQVLGTDLVMEIKYEDFLESPFMFLKSLSHFCGLSASEKEIEKIARHIKKNRGYAFRSNSDLFDLSEQVTEVLKKYGY